MQWLWSILLASMQVLAADDVKDKKVERIVVGPRFKVVSPISSVRGYLGVSLLDLTPELREHFGRKETGVMVSRATRRRSGGESGTSGWRCHHRHRRHRCR